MLLSSPIHEIGHYLAARILSKGTVKTKIAFSHTKFQNIEKQPQEMVKKIALAGPIFQTVFLILITVANMALAIMFFSGKKKGLTVIFAIIVFFVVELINFFTNIIPRKCKNDGYYFLYPDEIKDEEF